MAKMKKVTKKQFAVIQEEIESRQEKLNHLNDILEKFQLLNSKAIEESKSNIKKTREGAQFRMRSYGNDIKKIQKQIDELEEEINNFELITEEL